MCIAKTFYQDVVAADGFSGYILHPWIRFPPVIEPVMPLLATSTLMRILLDRTRCNLMLIPSSECSRCIFPLPGAPGAAVLWMSQHHSFPTYGPRP